MVHYEVYLATSLIEPDKIPAEIIKRGAEQRGRHNIFTSSNLEEQ
jgi:hypothetical protein